MTIPTKPQLEALLQAAIFPDLERGRPKWDVPHTVLVVAALKRLLVADSAPQLDRTVMLIAAYAHDWGYADLFAGKESASLAEVREMKPLHMRLGSEKLAALLESSEFEWLDRHKAARAVHLVSVHDNLPILAAPDELLLMEADTLGALGASPENSTFDRGSNERYLETVAGKRLPLFVSEFGKAECVRLMGDYRRKFLGKP